MRDLLKCLQISLHILVAIAACTTGSTRADSPTSSAEFKSLKVVGRGVQNKKTDESLQLACVGKRTQKESLERECDVLNFLLTDASGIQSLVGKPFYITEDSGKSVKKQLKTQMQNRGLQNNPGSSEKMANIRGLFQKHDELGARASALAFSALAIIGGLPLWGLAIGPAMLLMVDIVKLPFAIVDDARYGAKALNVKNAQALRDRATAQWQIRPKRVHAKYFNAVVGILKEEGDHSSEVAVIGDQIKESEEDLRATEDESRVLLEGAIPRFTGDTNSECFVDSLEVSYVNGIEGISLMALGLEYLKEHPLSAGAEMKLTDAMIEKIGVMSALRQQGFTFDDAAVLLGGGTRGSTLKFKIRHHRLSDWGINKFVSEARLLRGGEELGRSISKRTLSHLYGKSVSRATAQMTSEALTYYAPTCGDLTSRKTHRRSGVFF